MYTSFILTFLCSPCHYALPSPFFHLIFQPYCALFSGTYIDKKCPFTGTVSIRGRIIAGTCHSAKMDKTIIVRRNYLHFVKKYQRYEKRHSNIPAHISPCFRVKEGDHVIIGQCRPLSKTVRFNVLKVIPAGSSGTGKKAFTGA
ncbi:OLC1v1027963C2 [Oldenlandia corymbosa var. corymbosa]|uniref:Small ribosomal subunit protein uS17 n=1 Tax=Oldenlandia corymbosa var. corymbosa TaxID=529605 RepID=A0AAV1CDK7_OLDCO|nr:OLC1v1027963C2 [Oldenlandia corymbosa var. corymbosa]